MSTPEPKPMSTQHLKDEKAINEQQQELQAKILSILNGSGPAAPPAPPAPTHMNQSYPPPQPQYSQQMALPSHQQQRPMQVQSPQQASSSTSINFDNPSVQRALDNLISSGPNLLRNISATSSMPQSQTTMSKPQMGPTSMPQSRMAAMSPAQQGGMGDMNRAQPQGGMMGRAPPLQMNPGHREMNRGGAPPQQFMHNQQRHY